MDSKHLGLVQNGCCYCKVELQQILAAVVRYRNLHLLAVSKRDLRFEDECAPIRGLNFISSMDSALIPSHEKLNSIRYNRLIEFEDDGCLGRDPFCIVSREAVNDRVRGHAKDWKDCY